MAATSAVRRVELTLILTTHDSSPESAVRKKLQDVIQRDMARIIDQAKALLVPR